MCLEKRFRLLRAISIQWHQEKLLTKHVTFATIRCRENKVAKHTVVIAKTHAISQQPAQTYSIDLHLLILAFVRLLSKHHVHLGCACMQASHDWICTSSHASVAAIRKWKDDVIKIWLIKRSLMTTIVEQLVWYASYQAWQQRLTVNQNLWISTVQYLD